MGPLHLERVERYLDAMASVSMMEYLVLLGRFHIVGALLLGGINPCIRGLPKDDVGEEEMEAALLAVGAGALTRFFDCFPLSLKWILTGLQIYKKSEPDTR